MDPNANNNHYPQFPPHLSAPPSGDQNNILIMPLPPSLVFLNEVGDYIYAGYLVKAKNGDPIKVAIKNTQSIRPGCPLPSVKVKIVVLNAEFLQNKGETLSRVEFNESVFREENRGPILRGSLVIQLKDGVGTFENIAFNYNSCGTKGFRLGVVMVDSDGEEGCLDGKRVQEGVSEPFRVKDRKSKANEKPKLLKLTDSVRCINGVGNIRGTLLEKANINTVVDFLKLYHNDKSALFKILRIKSKSHKAWMSMVAHVMLCANEVHAQQVPGERNISNGGRPVGCGPSVPNPSENDRTEGDPMAAINKQPSSNGDDFCSFFNEKWDLQQPTNGFSGDDPLLISGCPY